MEGRTGAGVRAEDGEGAADAGARGDRRGKRVRDVGTTRASPTLQGFFLTCRGERRVARVVGEGRHRRAVVVRVREGDND